MRAALSARPATSEVALSAQDAERLRRYRAFQDFYDGKHFAAPRGRGARSGLVLNYARAIVDKGVSYLLGGGVGFAVEPEAEADAAERARAQRAEALLYRAEEEVARVVDRAWQEDDPGHLDRAAQAGGRIVLAGGLGPDNVREAIERTRPWAVDASSSLETEPGVKDHERIRAFVGAVRG